MDVNSNEGKNPQRKNRSSFLTDVVVVLAVAGTAALAVLGGVLSLYHFLGARSRLVPAARRDKKLRSFPCLPRRKPAPLTGHRRHSSH